MLNVAIGAMLSPDGSCRIRNLKVLEFRELYALTGSIMAIYLQVVFILIIHKVTRSGKASDFTGTPQNQGTLGSR